MKKILLTLSILAINAHAMEIPPPIPKKETKRVIKIALSKKLNVSIEQDWNEDDRVFSYVHVTIKAKPGKINRIEIIFSLQDEPEKIIFFLQNKNIYLPIEKLAEYPNLIKLVEKITKIIITTKNIFNNKKYLSKKHIIKGLKSAIKKALKARGAKWEKIDTEERTDYLKENYFK